MQPIPIIGNGHGGIIAGIYQTKGKRSPVWPDGTVLYEGEFNRAIKYRVIEKLHAKGIPFIDLVPEQEDIKRSVRIDRANDWHKKLNRNTFLIDIHSNAGGGIGSEVFIAKNASANSHLLAELSQLLFLDLFPESIWRGIKKKNFDMVHLTDMPAILIENFFMDNKHECFTYLMTAEGRERIANYIVAIIEAYRKKFAYV